MNPKLYTVADLHIGHANIAKKRGFSDVESHDDHIIERWNSVVNDQDTVWVLGDAWWLGTESLRRMNGKVLLIAGNHDHKHREYAKLGIKVRSMREVVIPGVGNCIFTHIPIHYCNFGRWVKNVHGHLHEDSVMTETCSDACNFTEVIDKRYRCVSVEQTDYKPLQVNMELFSSHHVN